MILFLSSQNSPSYNALQFQLIRCRRLDYFVANTNALQSPQEPKKRTQNAMQPIQGPPSRFLPSPATNRSRALTAPTEIAPELARVIDLWPDLPEALRLALARWPELPDRGNPGGNTGFHTPIIPSRRSL